LVEHSLGKTEVSGSIPDNGSMGKIEQVNIPDAPPDAPSTGASIAKGIKLIAWSRTVRYIGWGFGESLIPIFIFTFSHTFAEAGLMRSVLDVVSLLVLPLVGAWADRASGRSLILISLLVYPFVGIGYFLAGVTGAAIFVVFARAINGFTVKLENIGVDMYYERMSPLANIGSAFGYIDSWSNFGWIAAALAGILLLPFFPVHVLLFAIAPFALIAFLFVKKAPEDAVPRRKNPQAKPSLVGSYKSTLGQCRLWSRHLWLLCALAVFEGIISSLMWFFIPIDAYVDGANAAMVVFLVVIATIPSLFGYLFGRFSDRGNKYLLLALGLFIIGGTMAAMAAFPSYAVKLAASLVLGLLLEFFSVIERSLVVGLGPAELYGERQSAFSSIATLGGLAAPLALGVLLDSFGFSHASLFIGYAALFFALVYFLLRNRKPAC
jgi:MFS family permease